MKYIRACYLSSAFALSFTDAERILFTVDFNRQTFLHTAAANKLSMSSQTSTAVDENISVEMIKKIISVFPRRMALKLSLIEDENQSTACDLARFGLKRDILHQMGSFSLDFYHLETAPNVWVFCDTKTRQSYAVKEKECVEDFFRKRSFPCNVQENPTSADIFYAISKAAEAELSALIVFIMCHGRNGIVQVDEGGYVVVQDIITHMCDQTALTGKPKV